MNKTLTTIALRYQAIYLDINPADIDMQSTSTIPVLAFIARLRENGYCVNEQLLHALSKESTDTLSDITLCINEILKTDLNWTPLVKGWDTPTGENVVDHIITWIANIFQDSIEVEGTRLPCGHLIPKGTFPIERYNGCPFCGTPFHTSDFVFKGQASKLKELRLFTRHDLEKIFNDLLTSSVPLDATQSDTLQLLLQEFPLPDDVSIPMKESAILVIKALVKQDKADEAMRFLKTPTDILRYLWYENIGQVQIIEPKTLIAIARRNNSHWCESLDESEKAAQEMVEALKLKYGRKTCRTIASWMNQLPMTAQQAAENMNPKRGMWVRMIHALRLGDYARRPSYRHLAEILDVFYHQDYRTWQGCVDKAQRENSADEVLALLKERPGAFARCLFATMLRFGSDKVIAAFNEVTEQLPVRLLLSLCNAAEIYFDPQQTRLARPITGGVHDIPTNKLLVLYSEEERKAMVESVMQCFRNSMKQRYQKQANTHKTIYIDSSLFDIPVNVGDRSTTIQDTSCALLGTRFPIEGDSIRLFMQWGKGLPAQPLDMDLSCRISLPNDEVADCAYYNLVCPGAKHSGDIRSIPDLVGTAEYIELSLKELEEFKASHVTFTCNAYSVGSISPNLVVGWMNSAYPMTIDEETGVAYDPSCVQHSVRISESNLSKGLVFGILDVEKREIIWVEMPFTGQTLMSARQSDIEALLHRLEHKTSIGQLLTLKAEAQQMTIVDDPELAEEVYSYQWALNPAEVTKVLFTE